MIFAVPCDETLDAVRDGCSRGVLLHLFESADVGESVRDVSGLQRQEFADGGLSEGCFNRVNVFAKMRRVIVADVEDAKRRVAGSRIRIEGIPVRVRLRGKVVRPDHAGDYVVDIGEIANVIAVVEWLYGCAGQDGLGEGEKRHVRSTPWTVDIKEPQPGRRQTGKMAVAVCHQFVCACGGGIELQGMVDPGMFRKRHGRIRDIDTGCRSVCEVGHCMMAARLKYIGEADEIAFNIWASISAR